MSKKFLINRSNSLLNALAGVKSALLTQHNLVIQFIAAIVAIAFGLFFKISISEFCFIIFSIILVIALELINTAVESLCDFIHPDKHEKIKQIKDISAAAVLIAAIGALTVGLFIFVPKIVLLTQ